MKCILHIGTEKTASTSIQSWLYLNKERLSEQGIALSEHIGIPNNRMLCSLFQNEFDDFYDVNKIKTLKDKEIFFSGFLEKFSDEISALATNHDYMIITSEHFHSRLKTVEEIASLRAFLLKCFSEVTVVCYFREQSSLRMSLYSTAVKNNYSLGVDVFLSEINDTNIYFNYHLMFSQWEDVFGKDSLIPLIYHKNYWYGGDIRKDFIKKSLNIVDVEKFNYAQQNKNIHLSQLQAFLFRVINSIEYDRFDEYDNKLVKKLKDHIENDDRLKKGEIIDLMQLDIWHRFNESNVNFFEHYFGISQNIFPPPELKSMNQSSDSFFYSNQNEVIDGIVSMFKVLKNHK